MEEAAYPHTYNPNYTLVSIYSNCSIQYIHTFIHVCEIMHDVSVIIHTTLQQDISVQVSVSPQKRGKTPSKSESKFRSTVQSDKQRERKTEVGGAVGGRVCEEGETGEGANDPVEKEKVPESDIVKGYQLELDALDRVAREKRRCGGNSEPVDKEEAVTGDVVESDIVRRFQQHLDELNNAARDKRRRKSRRLQQKDPDVAAPPTAPPPAPSGLRGRRQQPRQRRSRRTRKREEALTDSQIPDSQVLQVSQPHSNVVVWVCVSECMCWCECLCVSGDL